MASPMVASAAAASSDPAWAYPAAKPAAAPSVPHTSASPNRFRHARHHPAGGSGTGDAMTASALPAVTAAPPMDTPVIAPPAFVSRRGAARFLIHLQLELIMKIGRLRDAMKPDIQCVLVFRSYAA